jgi:hypothetical protein
MRLTPEQWADAHKRVFHCSKCGTERDVPCGLSLAGVGLVCFSCFVLGNKDDPRQQHKKELMRTIKIKNARLATEGKGLSRFVVGDANENV